MLPTRPRLRPASALRAAGHNDDEDTVPPSPATPGTIINPFARALARAAPPAAITLLNLLGGGLGLGGMPPPSSAGAAETSTLTTSMMPAALASRWGGGEEGSGGGGAAPFSPRDGRGKRVQEMNRRFTRHVRAW